MTVPDPHLQDLAQQLAAMGPGDRAFVLDQLTDEEARVLTPYLESLADHPLSPQLGELAGRCVEGAVPDGIRPLAAKAIASAILSATHGKSTMVERRPVRAMSFCVRAANLLARR